MSDEREREIGFAAAKLRERGTWWRSPLALKRSPDATCSLTERPYTFHAFLDLVRSVDVTA